jgi:hypothetical protein
MLKTECAELLREVAAIDNRKMGQDVLDAWFAVIGFLPYEVALKALHAARKDERVTWLEPKHIVAFSKEDRLARQDDDYLKEMSEAVFGPVPYCVHGEVIAMCLPCCKEKQEELGL